MPYRQTPATPRRGGLFILACLLLGGPLAPVVAAETPHAATTATDAARLGNDVHVPHRGQTMAFVEHRFGPPELKFPPVGQPPISRWVYGDFTVYFENQYVIGLVRDR